jgi:YYY domain-containing protein
MVLGLLVVRWSEVWRQLARRERLGMARNTVLLWLLLFVGAFAAMFLSLVPLFVTERGRAFLDGLRHNEAVREMIGDLPWGDLLAQLIARRLASPWTSFFLALFLAVLIVLLLRGLRRKKAGDTDPGTGSVPADPSTTFVLWITLMGLALTFSVEFVYLRDTFGTRMNTVFKFYYQAWVLLSLSGAYAVFYVLQGSLMRRPRSRPARWGRLVWALVLLALFGMSAVYPLVASYNKAGGYQAAPTLDGTAYMAEHHPDDHAAIEWLNENVEGAPGIVEATGGSYSYFARVSAQTGLPTVLGWGGHELQWRGNYDEAGRREPDISTIYESLDPDLTLTLLDKYGIKYVYVGDLERQKYPQLTMAKFDQLFDVAYRNDSVTIYEYRD